MKKVFALILAVAMLLPCFAVGDVDVSCMTDQELKDLIMACSAELRERMKTTDPEGILLFNESGVRLYQLGNAYIERGRIKIPCMMYNDLEYGASVSPISVVCNDYAVGGYTGGELPAKSRGKCELDFATADLELKSLDEVYSLIFAWQIYSLEKPGIVYTSPEREEHRFW